MVLECYTSQNCRILFSLRLCWLCMNKRIFETTKNRDWSDNEDAELQSLERNSGKRSSNQEVKREKASVDRKVWHAVSGKQVDNFQKETHVVSVMIQCLETDVIRNKKGESSSLAPKAKAQTDGQIPSKSSGSRGESLSGTRGKIPCRNFLGRKYTCPSCNFSHPPVCLKFKSASRCKYGDKCRFFSHVEVDGQPSKKSKKSGGRNPLPCWRSSYTWVVCLKITIRENLFYGKKENWNQITPSNSPRVRGTTSKFGKERVHREELFKSVNFMSAIRALPDLRKEHKTKRCTKKDAPAESHGIWRKVSTSSKKYGQSYGQPWRPLREFQENENSWLTLEHQWRCWAKKFWAQMNRRLCGDPGPPQRW